MAEISKKYLDQQFDKMALIFKKSFDPIEARLGSVEIRLGSVESRLTGVESEMLKVHDRLRTVEEKVDRALYKQYNHLENRVDKIEKHLKLKTA